jgi:TonB family protein
MLVWATRTLWALVLRALVLTSLFVFVIVVQVAMLSALRGMGWSPSAALGGSGVAVLVIVLGAHFGSRWNTARRQRALEARGAALGLPSGPCCLVWRGMPQDDIPWELQDGRFEMRYPPEAQALGIEGVAVVTFEIGADGVAKNIHCLDVWPAPVFYDAAVEALQAARFRPATLSPPQFGASYRVPFQFRIRNASRIKTKGIRASRPRPRVEAVRAAAKRVQQSAADLTKRQSL